MIVVNVKYALPQEENVESENMRHLVLYHAVAEYLPYFKLKTPSLFVEFSYTSQSRAKHLSAVISSHTALLAGSCEIIVTSAAAV